MSVRERVRSLSTAEEFKELAHGFMFEDFDANEAMELLPEVVSKGQSLQQPDCVAAIVDVLFATASQIWPDGAPSDDQLMNLDSFLSSGIETFEYPLTHSREGFCLRCAGIFLPTTYGQFDYSPSDFSRSAAYRWIDRAVDCCLRQEKAAAQDSLKEVVKAVSGDYVGLQIADKIKGNAIIDCSAEVFGKAFSDKLRKSCKDYL